ncbi:MAG: YkvA family protein [Candidatus Sumerlaeia bacterium]|nr:YkvA family protein [Candidatus Sumerlaeia bacterium]
MADQRRIHKLLDERRGTTAADAATGILDDLRTLWGMVRDPRYRFPKWVPVTILLGLLYLMSPVDIIPDFIPVLGTLDDAGLAALFALALRDLVARYRAGRR